MTVNVKLEPRDYQVSGALELIKNKRFMLTDQAGLGKTLTATIAAMPFKPVLVVAPTYLVVQWGEFLQSQFPEDKVNIATGSREQRNQALYDPKADWVVINVQMLRGYNIPKRFDTIIFDEAHHLRNRNSMQAKSAAKVAADLGKRVYLLTATPIFKSVDDVWHLLHILYPNIFSSYDEFVKAYLDTDSNPYGPRVTGVKGHRRWEIEQLLDKVRIGRSYKDVGRSLPPVVETNIKVELPDVYKDPYKDALAGFIEAFEENGEDYIMTSYMEILHILRDLTANPAKIKATLDSLEDTILDVENSKPALVFTWYRESANRLYNAINNDPRFKDVPVVLINGDTPATERNKVANSAKIVIATMQSMGEGVNLYNSRTVIFFEEDWTPGRNYQALSRVRRDRNDDGQDMEPVRVYYMQCKGTVDGHIHNVSKMREATARDLMRELLQ